MPLTAAMTRFLDAAELIKARASDDMGFKELCEDYQSARERLSSLLKMKPRKIAEIAEYKMLVEELENEIIEQLTNTGKPKK